jgi:hypothetical protein
MEKILRHSLDVLGVVPEDHAVLLSESPVNSRANREKMVEIMLEKFNVASVFVANSAVLSLYAAGRTTGLVCELGEDAMYVVPIYEGFSLSHATRVLEIGGRDLTAHMGRLGCNKGYSFPTDPWQQVSALKESLCYCAKDIELELKSGVSHLSRELQDGKTVTLGEERFLCCEPLFQPSLLKLNEEFPFVAEWARLRLLWLGRTDEGSVLFGVLHFCMERVIFLGGSLISRTICCMEAMGLRSEEALGHIERAWVVGHDCPVSIFLRFRTAFRPLEKYCAFWWNIFVSRDS